jgi:hypothetical protein
VTKPSQHTRCCQSNTHAETLHGAGAAGCAAAVFFYMRTHAGRCGSVRRSIQNCEWCLYHEVALSSPSLSLQSLAARHHCWRWRRRPSLHVAAAPVAPSDPSVPPAAAPRASSPRRCARSTAARRRPARRARGAATPRSHCMGQPEYHPTGTPPHRAAGCTRHRHHPHLNPARCRSTLRKRHSFVSFPYVCPEPVLVK